MSAETEVRMIPVEKLTPSPFQPRGSFSNESLEELTASIKGSGLVQPILVRTKGNQFEIVAGERRWRAYQLAGFKTIPSIVRDIDDEEARELSLIENWHREDLKNEEREKMVYTAWMSGKKSGRYHSIADMAGKFGVSVSTIRNFINSWEEKQTGGYSKDTPTFVMVETRGLEEETRKGLIQKIEKGDVRKETYAVREYVKVLKDAPKTVQKAVLKPKSRITPRVAQKMLELPERKQIEAIRQVEALRLDEDEAISHIEAVKVEVPLPPPEDIEAVRERYQELQREIKAKLTTGEAQERGELFRNWSSHIAVAGIKDSISCPICNSKKLGWTCHNLSIEDALTEAENKYKRDLNRNKHRGKGA